ncbi:glycosyltransferase 87 family protein [Streptomyces sp. 029-5]|uniref:glycosyltransferase 87 family protein n=1 Tax=Streptomyces sp. 029-5 TaxID=2789261 RepID=UPI003980F9E2
MSRVRDALTTRAATGRRPAIAAALVVATAVFLATVPLHRGFFDVGVYYGTVNDWIHHDGRIYDYLRPGTQYGFTYPPFAAVVMLPMALVSWHVAIGISAVLSAVASALLLRWLAGPAVRRLVARRADPGTGTERGGDRRPWFVFVVAGCLFALFEPVRDTFSFGQVNLLLVALVFADARLLTTGRGRYAGIGIGLATAIKLTPALFIGYLLITGRRRQAGVATGTAGAATLLAALIDPGASRTFWTVALWDTDRVGSLGYVSNQSLQGVLARLQPEDHPSRLVWLVCVLAVLAVWAYRARAAVRDGDDRTGFALTGLAACLVSPVTWVHHLVWLIPALLVLTDSALSREPGARRRSLVVCAALYVVLCSSVVWLWRWDSTGPAAFLGANAYVWITLGLLLVPPGPDERTRPVSGPGAGPRVRRLPGAETAAVTDGVAATRSAGTWRRRAVDPSGGPEPSG